MVETRISGHVQLLLTLLLSTSVFPLLAQKECLVHLPAMIQQESARHWLDDDSVLTIPVVLHIISHDSTLWVGDEVLDNQLESLNRDFRRLNIDRDQTPKEFMEVAADCKVEFCLATVDPTGAATTGVERSITQVEEIGLTDSYYQSFLGGQSAWDPQFYLNIWICEISKEGDVAGFSSMPGDNSGAADGVVIDYRFFGEGDYVNPTFAEGRTLTHEIGHWLGLEHTWGSEPGCDTDDGIDDTPKQFDRYRGCPQFPQLSCGSIDMYMNFMDLTDDLCMNLFTEGQKTRMRNTLLIERSAILTSVGCNAVTTASFYSNFNAVSIFPNPANTYLEILTTSQVGYEISILSVDGLRVLSTSHINRVNISDLKEGIYFLTLRSSTQLYSFRFIKI